MAQNNSFHRTTQTQAKAILQSTVTQLLHWNTIEKRMRGRWGQILVTPTKAQPSSLGDECKLEYINIWKI